MKNFMKKTISYILLFVLALTSIIAVDYINQNDAKAEAELRYVIFQYSIENNGFIAQEIPPINLLDDATFDLELVTTDSNSTGYEESDVFVGWILGKSGGFDGFSYYKPGSTIRFSEPDIGSDDNYQIYPLWIADMGLTFQYLDSNGNADGYEIALPLTSYDYTDGGSLEAYEVQKYWTPDIGTLTFSTKLNAAPAVDAPGKEFVGWKCSLDDKIYSVGSTYSYTVHAESDPELPEITFTPVYTDKQAAEEATASSISAIASPIASTIEAINLKVQKLVRLGKLTLERGVAYSLGSGKYVIEGDDTVYNGNQSFYVGSAGDYNLQDANTANLDKDTIASKAIGDE